MSGLRFTTIVDAPLTVAFDVARALGRPWGVPLQELDSVRPERDRYALTDRRGRRVVHSRRFTATGSGTRVDDEFRWIPRRLLAGAGDRRRVRRAMQAHLDAYAAAATERALEVVQVVGAAVIEGGRLLVPVGSREEQMLCVYTRRGDALDRREIAPVRFVPLVGVHGWPN